MFNQQNTNHAEKVARVLKRVTLRIINRYRTVEALGVDYPEFEDDIRVACKDLRHAIISLLDVEEKLHEQSKNASVHTQKGA